MRALIPISISPPLLLSYPKSLPWFFFIFPFHSSISLALHPFLLGYSSLISHSRTGSSPFVALGKLCVYVWVICLKLQACRLNITAFTMGNAQIPFDKEYVCSCEQFCLKLKVEYFMNVCLLFVKLSAAILFSENGHASCIIHCVNSR